MRSLRGLSSGLLTFIALSTLPVRGEIDDWITRDCASDEVELPEPASDTTFLRRVYFTAIGRAPTLAEANQFLSSTDPGKRESLIDSLLNSEGYAKHWFHFWADLLRISTDVEITRSGITGQAYSQWLIDSLADNVPYDQLVRNLLSRQGNIWEEENAGAVGFFLRDFGMPLENFGGLMQVFAGTRMECAQCHNHPFDKWTQRDFYEMAAFTYNVRGSKYPDIYTQIKGPEKPSINQLTIPMRFGTVTKRDWPLKLPHDYQYDDAKPFAEITARTSFGDSVRVQPGELPMETFANWLTSSSNPRFTRVIVNRLWEQLWGAALVPPPLDDLRDETAAHNPALESGLIQLMKTNQYDLKRFLSSVMKSDAWQRKALTRSYSPGERVYFEAPFLTRLSAEQIWDTFVTLVVDDPERPHFQRNADRISRLNDLRIRASRFDGKSAESVATWLRTSEGYHLARQKGRAPSPEAIALLARQKSSMKALDKTRSDKVGSKKAFLQWKSSHAKLYRASEISSPAPRGHFLRTFGQSDRQSISNANRDASVPQSLAIYNGELTEGVMNPYSALLREARNHPKKAAQIDVLFLGILTRVATGREAKLATEESLEDLIAALLTTKEFLFLR
ncbi:DUF1549 and DUF1553 domain-containing protein [Verrucomicrobiales bacterium]|nr:DUF1549 and DUF1553 domain-containing protein [Verrucomicrobiales bacterium]